MAFQILGETFRFPLDGCYNSLYNKLNQLGYKQKSPLKFLKPVRTFFYLAIIYTTIFFFPSTSGLLSSILSI